MNKLEKSIRCALKPFGPDIRNGHVWIPGYSVGIIGNDDYFLSSAYADVDTEAGIITDIRLYAVGDAKEPYDYYGKSLNITDQISQYILERNDNMTWNDLINSIIDVVDHWINETAGN